MTSTLPYTVPTHQAPGGQSDNSHHLWVLLRAVLVLGNSCARTHTCTHTHMCLLHVCMHMYTNTYTHAHAFMQVCLYTCLCICVHDTHMHPYPYTRRHSAMHTRTNNISRHANINTHPATLSSSLYLGWNLGAGAQQVLQCDRVHVRPLGCGLPLLKEYSLCGVCWRRKR